MSEVHYTTKQSEKMRRVMCAAIGDGNGRRPDRVRLLVIGGGKREPEVARAKLMVQHGQAEVEGFAIPEDNWTSLKGTAGEGGRLR